MESVTFQPAAVQPDELRRLQAFSFGASRDMHACAEPSLRFPGTFFHGAPQLHAEWSLRISETEIDERSRITFWIASGSAADEEPGFPSIERLLEAIGAPEAVRERQKILSPDCIWQGFGASSGTPDREYALYLHHSDTKTGEVRYDACKWGAEGVVESSRYEFFFFPCAPDGRRPSGFIHPRLSGTFDGLVGNRRLQSMSGFWLRHRHSQTDQVDLVFPWHPPLQLLFDVLKRTDFVSAAALDALMAYRSHPVRHVAFSAANGSEPVITVYFSAPLSGDWPRDFPSLQEAIRISGNALHDALEERIFAHIPQCSASGPDAFLDTFYSTGSVDTWRRVLGANMHYHFGMFSKEEREGSLNIFSDEPFERAVTDLFDCIPYGSSVYDVGCGWGGPARRLSRDHGCRVLGCTISETQYRYLFASGLQVRYADAETTLPPGFFDCMLLLESLEHVRDKAGLLGRLRLFGNKLVMRVHCQDGAPNSVNFAGTMHMIRSTELRGMIEEAGWHIVHWRNRREESMPSLRVWHERLAQIPPGRDVHLETFRSFCSRVCQCEEEWAASNPLIEVVSLREPSVLQSTAAGAGSRLL
ncbi:SAM-dependent methyltransferase [Chlorobium limicola]|nr:class I SAM-dependent methyltransferase [Chlorobium limicola]